MDSVVVESKKNYEEKAEKVRLLVPNMPQLSVSPVRNDSSGQLKIIDEQPIRTRKSFCLNHDTTGSRRPSAIVSAIPQDQRRSSAGNIIFELVF